MNEKLAQIAKSLVTPEKGILAADESTKTIEKRFVAVGISSVPETHRKYRQVLLTTPGIEEFLSGVILFDETARQKTDVGISFPEYLQSRGIVPGIKVDEGKEAFGEEEVTRGLENLPPRLEEYSRMGFKFTKWRAPIKITGVYPSPEMISESVKRMAEYAKISQEAGLVPIPEPEVLIDGNHTTARCEEVTTLVLRTLFAKLKEKGVFLPGLVLKVNMVLPGKDSGIKAAPLEVAQATLRTLKNTVPAEIAGIVFLSGGQTPEEATENLNEINKLKDNAPWPLSFSFARALQNEALEVWRGEDANIENAQKVFFKRAKSVSLARQGRYQKEMEAK